VIAAPSLASRASDGSACQQNARTHKTANNGRIMAWLPENPTSGHWSRASIQQFGRWLPQAATSPKPEVTDA
jgi:hypothetical protein